MLTPMHDQENPQDCVLCATVIHALRKVEMRVLRRYSTPNPAPVTLRQVHLTMARYSPHRTLEEVADMFYGDRREVRQAEIAVRRFAVSAHIATPQEMGYGPTASHRDPFFANGPR